MLDYTVQIVSLRPHKKTILASGKTHTVFLGNLATLIWAYVVCFCVVCKKKVLMEGLGICVNIVRQIYYKHLTVLSCEVFL